MYANKKINKSFVANDKSPIFAIELLIFLKDENYVRETSLAGYKR